MPLVPIFSMRDVERYIDKFQDRAEDALLQTLIYTGEYFVKIARERSVKNSFRDVTGNLRSSIGYVIVRDGKMIIENFENAGTGPEGNTGVQQGRRLARELASANNRGLVLIGMAGMDYALYVENIKNKDVISGPEVQARKMLKDLIKKVKR